MKTITIFTKEDFRDFLKKHHKKETKLAVIIHKKHTGKPSPSHRELIEEAISFGWIDTTINRLDEDAYKRHFSKRTKNSTWSKNTLSYGKKLIEEGRMTEEGLKFYKLGLKKPPHDFDIPENPTMPAELKKALSKNKKAKEKFETFPPSKKKEFYRWVIRAKLPATREKRSQSIIKEALDKK